MVSLVIEGFQYKVLYFTINFLMIHCPLHDCSLVFKFKICKVLPIRLDYYHLIIAFFTNSNLIQFIILCTFSQFGNWLYMVL